MRLAGMSAAALELFSDLQIFFTFAPVLKGTA